MTNYIYEAIQELNEKKTESPTEARAREIKEEIAHLNVEVSKCDTGLEEESKKSCCKESK